MPSKIESKRDRVRFKFDVAPSALSHWDRSICAKKHKEEKMVLDVYSTIGEYGDGHGITAKMVSSFLKEADGGDVALNINSGGGDFFEGLAIHTLLDQYEGQVKVNVIGLAASAASIVAMAGDEINIAPGAFFMIHNAWTIALGNKEVMSEAADMLGRFDKSMAAIYAKKTGSESKEILKMMSAETWISGAEALEMGFASALMPESEILSTDEKYEAPAAKKIDVELAKAGVPRSERRALIKEVTSTPRAAESVMPRADNELQTALLGLLKTLNA